MINKNNNINLPSLTTTTKDNKITTTKDNKREITLQIDTRETEHKRRWLCKSLRNDQGLNDSSSDGFGEGKGQICGKCRKMQDAEVTSKLAY